MNNNTINFLSIMILLAGGRLLMFESHYHQFFIKMIMSSVASGLMIFGMCWLAVIILKAFYYKEVSKNV